MKIIFSSEGGVAVMTPAQLFLDSLPESWSELEKYQHVANKDIPTGTPYEIVQDSEIPEDRTFRSAWEYAAGVEEQISQDLRQEWAEKYDHKKEK